LATDHAAAPPRQVGFFVPSKFETEAAIPVPKDPTITIEPFPKAQYAVAVFGGFAKEADFTKAEAQLVAQLKKDGIKMVDNAQWSRVWAGYDSPFVLFNRHNEVWVQVQI
jgi:hypothetical protein